jgi:hypothetical protein
MKLNLTADGKIPDHFWKILLIAVASGVCGMHSDSILLIMGV